MRRLLPHARRWAQLTVQHWWRSLVARVVRRRRGPRFFELGGRRYEYLVHPVNRTWRNERAVEIPIARAALADHRGERILEVGNVMKLYDGGSYDVVDKYDESVIAVDIVDYRADPYDFILSVSTIEHIGWDEDQRLGLDEEPDRYKTRTAIAHLVGLLKPGGELLVTMPIGHNQHLDALIESGEISFDERRCLRRTADGRSWEEADWDLVKDATYDYERMTANAIVVGGIRKA
jgi:hypothetical protein